MINEALAEDVWREQRKKRCDDTTAAATPEPEPAASAARDSRESPIEPDLNPKRRLLMKSASSIASSSGQQRVKRSVTDIEAEMQTGDPLEMALVKAQRCPEHRQQTPDEEFSEFSASRSHHMRSS